MIVRDRLASLVGLPLLLALIALGCASSGEEEGGYEGPEARYSGSIGTVAVTIDETSEEAKPDTLIRYGVPEQVRSEVTTKLRSAGRQSDAGTARMDVKITSFRLRSGASAFWLGYMAGSDFIFVEVTVREGESPIKTYKTNTSTVLGGIAYTSPTKRKNRLVNTLTTRIVEGL